MNAIPFIRLMGHHGHAQYSAHPRMRRLGPRPPHLWPFFYYTGAGLAPAQPQHARNPHLTYFDGTTYSASSENSLILTTKACKTSIIPSYPFKWKGIRTMKAPTANLSGHWLFLTAGELGKRQSRTAKSSRDSLKSGSTECSSSLCL